MSLEFSRPEAKNSLENVIFSCKDCDVNKISNFTKKKN